MSLPSDTFSVETKLDKQTTQTESQYQFPEDEHKPIKLMEFEN
jgi:hypothetical protein